MMKAKVNLDTGNSIKRFVEICTRINEPVYLEDGDTEYTIEISKK